MRPKLIKASFTIFLLVGLIIPGVNFLAGDYSAGTFDLGIDSPTDNFEPVEVALNMKPGDEVRREIRAINVGNNPLGYSLTVEKISGDDNFCNALELEIVLEKEEIVPAGTEFVVPSYCELIEPTVMECRESGPSPNLNPPIFGESYPSGEEPPEASEPRVITERIYAYNGSLMNANFGVSYLGTSYPENENKLYFTASLPDETSPTLQNKTCEFKFVFYAQQVLTEPEEPTTEPEDTEPAETTPPAESDEESESAETTPPAESDEEGESNPTSTTPLSESGTSGYLDILSPNIALAYFSDTETITNILKSGQWEPFLSIEGEGASPTQENFDPNAIALLIQDYNPWFGKNTHDALNELDVPHDVINSSRLASWDLNKYQFIIYASAQDNNYYLNLKNNLQKISDFVSNGGLLIAHSCDGGWDGSGNWRGFSILPGGVTHLMHQDGWQYLSQSIHIVEPEHEIVKSNEFTLTDDYLDSWGYSTHGIFTNFLNNSNIKNPKIIMEADEGDGGDGPTYIEYDFRAGKVLATMQTVEWGYFNGSQGWVGNRPELLRNEIRFAKKWEKAPKEFWVEIKEDGECIYQEESLTTKLKCLPQGWILKVPNPKKKYKSWNDVPTTTQIIDATDGVSGWTNKEWLNYEAEKQQEWEDKTERLDPSKNPNEGGTVPIILEAVNHYYNNEEGIPANFRFEKELKRGMRDKEVKYLQMILKEEEFFPKDEICIFSFGPITEQAVKDFQANYELTVNGIVDKSTRDKLNQFLEQEKYNNLIIESPLFYISNDQKNYLSIFQDISFPIELILGIAAQETGPYVNWENEFVSFDWGRGIMQITTDKYVGQGSGIKWYKNEKINYCRGDEQACRHYYTNTPQGVWANIKDGLRVLQGKYALVNKSNLTDVTNTNCKDIKEITKEELIWLSTVYRYNQGSPYCAKKVANIWNCYNKTQEWNKCEDEINNYLSSYCGKNKSKEFVQENCNSEFDICLRKLVKGDPLYLKHIGEKLKKLGEKDYFGSEGTEYQNFDLANKCICANNNRIVLELRSPGEIRAYDDKGNITGLINGEIKEEILNSIYDKENNFITLFFPEESYKYEIKGITEGKYGFSASYIQNGEIITFNSEEIFVSTNTVHQYQIDWQALTQGEKGVRVNIDLEGDGIFDQTVSAGKEFHIEKTNLSYQGDTSGYFSDSINLKAVLTDESGNGILNKEIIFTIGTQTATSTTNENGIATTTLELKLIPKELTETYPLKVLFPGDDSYLISKDKIDFTLKSAKWLKKDAISELKSAKTGDRKTDKKIDKIIWFLNQSLNGNLWKDASHLVFFDKGKCKEIKDLNKLLEKDKLKLEEIKSKCPKSGIAVFHYEKVAVRLMMNEIRFKKNPNELKITFENIIEKLVKTDLLLAEVSLFEAKNTEIQNPKFEKIINHLIKRAERELIQANKELERKRPDKAIVRLSHSWLHSQLAIKFTNKK